MAKNDKVYVANWLISGHKGKDFQTGEDVRIPDDEAAEFLACGAIRLKTDEADAGAEGGEGESAPADDAQTGEAGQQLGEQPGEQQ